jgi:DNA-binding SARP family transcriptional activator
VTSSKLEVKLFGSIAVTRGSATLGARDFGGTKAKQLFELLVLARGEPVPKDRLADQIWGEALPVNVRGTLETYISVLRRKLTLPNGEGRGLITTEHEAYALPTAGYELDLDRFDELVRLSLATGSVLADDPYSEWAIDERWRYERRIIDTCIAAAAAAMADRDERAALAHAERAIKIEPLDERGYHAGLVALQALGRGRDAIALYRRACATMAEADAPPLSPALHALRDTIEGREEISPAPRARALRRTAATPRSAPTRLLGRAAELADLTRALQATRDGGSDLVLLSGELGIGKTTLLEAASRDLDGVAIGWARCSELVSGIPYAALALALREVLGASEVDVRSFPALAAVFPEMRVRSTRVAPRAVDALESLVALVDALAPLVLVLDDLHWADPDTLVAVDYLSSRRPLRGVTVAAALRSEEIGADHGAARLRPTMQIQLQPLGEHDLAPLGIDGLYHRTEGHPLFVSLAVAADDEGRRLRSEWVSNRCRAEGETAWRLLLAACLLEESFSASRLAAIVDMQTAEVAEQLDRLYRRRLLSLDDWRFRFRTRVMREALADSLSPASRSMLEQRIARDGAPGPDVARLEYRSRVSVSGRPSVPRATRARAVKRHLAS